MHLVGVFKEHLASHRWVVGERRTILMVFLDHCGYSAFVRYQNLKVVSPKLVNAEYGILATFSFSVLLKSIFLSCTWDDSFPHAWLCKIMHEPLRKYRFADWGSCSEWWYISLDMIKKHTGSYQHQSYQKSVEIRGRLSSSWVIAKSSNLWFCDRH